MFKFQIQNATRTDLHTTQLLYQQWTGGKYSSSYKQIIECCACACYSITHALGYFCSFNLLYNFFLNPSIRRWSIYFFLFADHSTTAEMFQNIRMLPKNQNKNNAQLPSFFFQHVAYTSYTPDCVYFFFRKISVVAQTNQPNLHCIIFNILVTTVHPLFPLSLIIIIIACITITCPTKNMLHNSTLCHKPSKKFVRFFWPRMYSFSFSIASYKKASANAIMI